MKLLLEAIARDSVCPTFARELWAGDGCRTTCFDRRQEGSPLPVQQLNGSDMDREESFELGIDPPNDTSAGNSPLTSRLFLTVTLTFTKHIMHWAASDRVSMDANLWQTRVVEGGKYWDQAGTTRSVSTTQKGTVNATGWFVEQAGALCSRAASVILDGMDRTPSSWRCLIAHARLVMKHSTAILEVMLEGGAQVHDDHADKTQQGAKEVPLADRLENTLVGQLLPAVVTGLLPFAHVPVFARRLLDVVASVVSLLDEACCRCPIIRRADGIYIATRNAEEGTSTKARVPHVRSSWRIIAECPFAKDDLGHTPARLSRVAAKNSHSVLQPAASS